MKYLSEADIINFNKMVIQKYSPKEPIGVLNKNSLNMIVENIKQEVYGQELYPSIEDKGAFLLYNLIKKHIFANGNKRTAYLTLKYFLLINNYHLEVKKDEAVDFIVYIAESSTDLEIISKWIKNHINKIE